jgi:quercetin dioxygenase-like cupin family protein|nr:cupin domain-containing protein [Allomuricauda sp.]|tara:strand:- start:18181 stop:18477 length:297 start_codon:yes stop_codon:yes gene_type:complete
MMYQIDESLKAQPFNGLQIKKLTKGSTFEVMGISLEKDAIFPEHTSPSDALLVVLEGHIDFFIDGKGFRLTQQENFSFPKETPHWVKARENTKFLIIR